MLRQRQALSGKIINQVLWILSPAQVEYQRLAAHASFAMHTVNAQTELVALANDFIKAGAGPYFYAITLHDVVQHQPGCLGHEHAHIRQLRRALCLRLDAPVGCRVFEGLEHLAQCRIAKAIDEYIAYRVGSDPVVSQRTRPGPVTCINDNQSFRSKPGHRAALQGVEQKTHACQPGTAHHTTAGCFHTVIKHNDAPSSFSYVGAVQKFWMIECLADKANQRPCTIRGETYAAEYTRAHSRR